MKKWIKKNWLYLALWTWVAVMIISNIIGYVQERNYKKEIRGLNQDIVSLKQDIKKEADKTQAALRDAKVFEDNAEKERKEKDEAKARIVVVEREKAGLREKIAALPPTRIVYRTIEILKVDPPDISLRDDGVLFTLVAARRNLEELEGFSLLKTQYGDLQFALAKSEKADKDTQAANVKLKKAVASQKIQIDKWPKIELKWDEKYKKSEKRNKTAFGRGRKQGTVIGAVIITVLWIFLGK